MILSPSVMRSYLFAAVVISTSSACSRWLPIEKPQPPTAPGNTLAVETIEGPTDGGRPLYYFDSDQDGRVSVDELQQTINAILFETKIRGMVPLCLDFDENGQINLSDYMHALNMSLGQEPLRKCKLKLYMSTFGIGEGSGDDSCLSKNDGTSTCRLAKFPGYDFGGFRTIANDPTKEPDYLFQHCGGETLSVGSRGVSTSENANIPIYYEKSLFDDPDNPQGPREGIHLSITRIHFDLWLAHPQYYVFSSTPPPLQSRFHLKLAGADGALHSVNQYSDADLVPFASRTAFRRNSRGEIEPFQYEIFHVDDVLEVGPLFSNQEKWKVHWTQSQGQSYQVPVFVVEQESIKVFEGQFGLNSFLEINPD